MSKLSIIGLSLLSALIGSAVVALGLLWALAAKPGLITMAPPAPIAGTGYEQLTAFHCRFGETKHMLIRGLDDNFTYGETEPTRSPDHLAHLAGVSSNSPYQRQYDEDGQDRHLSDWFDLPSNIVRGRFAIRVKARENYGGNVFYLGDLSSRGGIVQQFSPYVFASMLNDLPEQDGWTDHGDGLFTVQLEDLKFREQDLSRDHQIQRSHTHLLPYLAAQDVPPRLDLLVSDDTAVDFAGLALCTGPDEPHGMSFTVSDFVEAETDDYQVVACHPNVTERKCNAFYGDTPCGEALSLACYRDRQRPAPTLTDDDFDHAGIALNIVENWGGGDLEFTEPVAGNSFATLDDASAHCRSTFGEEWRVLDYHDGGEHNVATYPSSRLPDGRFWVDIRDQPHGTCWSRNPMPGDDDSPVLAKADAQAQLKLQDRAER